MDARHLAESAEAAMGDGGGCSATTAGAIDAKLARGREEAAHCWLASSASRLDSLTTRRDGAMRPVDGGTRPLLRRPQRPLAARRPAQRQRRRVAARSGGRQGREHGGPSTVVGSAVQCADLVCVCCERRVPFEWTASTRCCLDECGVCCDATTCRRVRRDERKRVGGAARREE